MYKKDVIEKEPKKLLLILLIFGFLASGIALFFEDVNMNIISDFSKDTLLYNILNSFFVIALCEELSKWFFTYYFCWKNKAFDYVYDGIVYAVFVAIGFATIENILAAVSANMDFISIILRGVLTVPLHVFMGVISGYCLGISKKYKSRGWTKKMKIPLLLSIVLPILIHGLFDYLIYLSTKNAIVLSILLIIFLYYFCFSKISEVSKENKKIVEKN